jgi:hypothetical protein
MERIVARAHDAKPHLRQYRARSSSRRRAVEGTLVRRETVRARGRRHGFARQATDERGIERRRDGAVRLFLDVA